MNTHANALQSWIKSYLDQQAAALAAVDAAAIAALITLLKQAVTEDRNIFIFGNGGSASNSSHFSTDLGKSASDALGQRFRIMTLNDNVSWMTAIGNDYAYEDVFSRQLDNFARPGDVAMTLTVSGSSPNVVKALRLARDRGLQTIALVGGKGGAASEIADHVLRIADTHYGRVEDVQMTICHLLAYAFVEKKAV